MAVIVGNDNPNTIRGSDFDDRIEGRGGNDTVYGYWGWDDIYGGSGNDALFGDAGDDYLSGASGADRLFGGGGFDLAIYDHSATGVTVNLTTGAASGGEAESDVLISIEDLAGSEVNDVLAGNSLGNVFFGNNGNDRLSGAGGRDVLEGGNGDDMLSGGAGFDLFVFTEFDDRDTVLDFAHGIDEIDLTDFRFRSYGEVFSYGDQVGADTVFDFGFGDTLRLTNENFDNLGSGDFII